MPTVTTTQGSNWASASAVHSIGDPYAPITIRAALPIEWAVGRLFDVWGVGEDVVLCPLPDHREKTASFNLWNPGPDGLPQKFGCFGCGERGDVLDLIQLAYGVGFSESKRIAVEEMLPEYSASDYTPGTVHRESVSAEKMRLNFRRMIETGHEDTTYRAFLANKSLEHVGTYARDEWRWGANEAVVYMPHRGADRVLTGVKLRAKGKKWSLDGSHYPHLYGSWRDRGHPVAIVCEGETDTVYTAWQYADIPVDVFGLASGTAQHPTPSALMLLRNRVTVWFILDGDDAGGRATTRWVDAIPGARVIPLPPGEDVLSCGIEVVDLIGDIKEDG